MPTDPPATPTTNWRLLAGYALTGLGWPMLMLAFFLVKVVFIPDRHGPAMVAFSLHHPIAIVAGCSAVVGGLMAGAGAMLIKAPSGAFRIFEDDGPRPPPADQRRLNP